MKKQWWILSTIIVLAIIAIIQSTSVRTEELPKTGYQAPNFSLQALDGQTYSLQSLNGKPVVINFWASWCGPCKIEAPELVRLYDKYKARIEIYAVNVTASDSIEGAKAFAQDFGFQFPVLIDEKGEVAQKYAIRPIPTTLFVNSEGIIIEQVIGLVDPQTMESKFRRLLP
ncbi:MULTISPECIES: TlpA family protein disulfide reductase [Paenibacillus]|uniref:Thiol:disulfide interchange protein n=1 Tax=Paenibacillus glucanolyticus TaxID=59843 RepID=A0A168ETX9_9BACL|nr:MULTISPECIES: TlpA disulfide reductase family protein [Paenibacillus]MCA4754161.1 TlpA family protein disulfide reductase [Mycolicibacterium fortuitum]ETT40477.1 thioredoxin family protein [Paenibacillus sp. FSL R5-808]KZS44844.1 thiol:disulfide interchange protein [Paenibacillus glucanolyticus]MDH6675052.1 cytochrome c biogenesis protein CcmG/thiol:disulfide interchange protein DsbE [Paenibacillus sp. LBL]MEC0254859.1 TlpA disulfide reductase family protein [Paenibacillus lautus]